MSALTDQDKSKLPGVIKFCKDYVDAQDHLPSTRVLAAGKKIGVNQCCRLLKHIIENKLVDAPAAPNGGDRTPESQQSRPKITEVNEIKKDTWSILLPTTRIHSVAQLLDAFEVDTEIWEVESFLVNKWEMGYVRKMTADTQVEPKLKGVDGAVTGGHSHTSKEYEADFEQLFQVKAKLKRKVFATIDKYSQECGRMRRLIEKLKLDVAYERDQAKRLAQNHVGADDLLTHVGEFVDKMGRDFALPSTNFEVTEPIIKPAVAATHSEDAVLLLSDFHFGDRIRREDTSNFPEFDLVIGGNRFGYTIGKAKQVLSIHRAFYPIKKLYVWIGGDIGNGILHDSPNSNELFVPAQVDFSFKIIKAALEDLHSLTVADEITGVRVVEEIVLLFSVGNHMRMDEKMPHKYQAQRTFDWLIYQCLIEAFRGRDNVTIHEEMSPFIFENIRGHRYVFFHGMQVGFRNKVKGQVNAVDSAMALIRALFDSPESRRTTGFTGATFERACIGDIHIPLKFPRFVSNGSLNGQNELGVNWTLEPIPAGQQIFGVSDRHLETWGYLLDSTHIQRKPDDMNPYGEFAAKYAHQWGR